MTKNSTLLTSRDLPKLIRTGMNKNVFFMPGILSYSYSVYA